jgi:hypothetical protein
MTDTTARPDGSNSVLRDSKFGLAFTFLAGIVLDTAISAVTNVDTTHWTGWWVPFVSLGLATAGGYLTTYRAKRRK